jgi:tetratricopeptide (TPR) repeat protein
MKYYIFFILIFSFGWSQDNPEDIALADDVFENHFYEALKHKATENYDLAINELNKCLSKSPENETVFYELGKNYFYAKNYTEAKTYFEKAVEKSPINRWFLDALFETEKKLGNTNAVMTLLNKLSEINVEYKEEMVDMYMLTKKYDEALNLIEELNKTQGKRASRTQIKERILAMPQFQSKAVAGAENAIKNDPKDEANYTALIKDYLDKNQFDQAFEVAKQLEKNIPNSPWAQVTLFKLYLDKNQTSEALKAIKFVINQPKIDKRIKHRMINELLTYSGKNPEVISPLKDIAFGFHDDEEVQVLKEIGKYFQNKKDWQNANEFYTAYDKKNQNDLENLMLLSESLYQLKNWDVLKNKSTELIETFPLQPHFYWYQGAALMLQNDLNKALKTTQDGLDYVVENPALEKQFYNLLSQIADKMGNQKLKEQYAKKAF